MEALDPTAWRSRCARRIAELDPDLTRSEAERLARDVHAFERTAPCCRRRRRIRLDRDQPAGAGAVRAALGAARRAEGLA